MSNPGNYLILGLRTSWVWVQPLGTEDILKRLVEARDCAVHERERENLCSVAHGEIMRLQALTSGARRLGSMTPPESAEQMATRLEDSSDRMICYASDRSYEPNNAAAIMREAAVMLLSLARENEGLDDATRTLEKSAHHWKDRADSLTAENARVIELHKGLMAEADRRYDAEIAESQRWREKAERAEALLEALNGMFDAADLFMRHSVDGGITWPAYDLETRVRLAIAVCKDDEEARRIEELEALLEAEMKDAGRYRWLRNNTGTEGTLRVFAGKPSQMDAAIDAAQKEPDRG